MQPIALEFDEYFSLVRAVAYAECKALRRTTDRFGDELLLLPESAMTKAPLKAAPGEVKAMARRVAGFFVFFTPGSRTLTGAFRCPYNRRRSR